MTTTKAIIIVGCVQPPSIFKKKKLERAPWPGNFFFFFKVTKVWLYAGYHDQCGSYLDADV